MAGARPGSVLSRVGGGRWLVAVVVGWVVVVVSSAGYAVFRGMPTAREQTTIAQALPTVDRAVADLVTAAEGARAVATIGGYVEADSACRVTSARPGARYARTVRFYTVPGAETELFRRIVGGLPRGYRARFSQTAGFVPLHADAGNFVAITGTTVGAGQVRVVADTGCRPRGAPLAEPDLAAVPPAGNRAAVEAVLATLTVHDVQWRSYRVACAAGGAVWTVAADGGLYSVPSSFGSASRELAAGAVVVDRPEVFAYRSGPTGIAVTTVDTTVVVTATTGCRS